MEFVSCGHFFNAFGGKKNKTFGKELYLIAAGAYWPEGRRFH